MTQQITRYPSLAGKHIFITGGATGIGAALVEAFAGQGAMVSFIDINEAAGNKLSTALNESKTCRTHFECCDVTQIEKLQAAISNAALEFGDVHGLINNVANDQRFSIDEISPRQWHQSMAVNLDPAFFASQAVLPMMRKNKGGVILNFSSINALFGPPDMPSYITAKAALLGLTKSLARDLGEDNIRVNTILPGWVVTQRQLDNWLTPEEEAQWMRQVCLKKRLMPEDVAKLTLFLASDDAALITSQQFIIDGGRL